MNPFSLSMLQQAMNLPGGGRAPMGMKQAYMSMSPDQMRAFHQARQQQAMQNMPQGMNAAQKYLWGTAHGIPMASLGLSGEQINYYEQGLAGYALDPRTGQITKPNAYGGRDPVDPQSLGNAANTNMGQSGNPTFSSNWDYNFDGLSGRGGGAKANDGVDFGNVNNFSGGASDLGMSGYSSYGSPPGSAGNAVSNLGGGAGNPNNQAGGLYGAAGNAIRQQMMDSSQFNPNGANTYAIQNMNLSGQGDLGSNMGGVGGSNGLFGGAIQTAQGTGSNSGQPMPTGAIGTQNPGMGVSTPQTSPTGTRTPSYFGGQVGGGLGGGHHSVIQGGVRGGPSGLGMGTGTTVNAYNPQAQHYSVPTGPNNPNTGGLPAGPTTSNAPTNTTTNPYQPRNPNTGGLPRAYAQ